MEAPAKKPASWSAIRRHLNAWENPALLALIKDLYDADAKNRDFLLARCQGDAGGSEALESYRKKIVDQFFPARGFGKLKLGEARKAIRDFRKASGSVSGTAELLMCYVENGAEFTHQYGDIDDRFYNSIESALDELAALLLQEPGLYPPFVERLAKVEQLTSGIGWGFHDFIIRVVFELDRELGDS